MLKTWTVFYMRILGKNRRFKALTVTLYDDKNAVKVTLSHDPNLNGIYSQLLTYFTNTLHFIHIQCLETKVCKNQPKNYSCIWRFNEKAGFNVSS